MSAAPLGAPGAVPPFSIVGIAASAGGLAALSAVVGGLPGDLPVPVVVVQHLDPRHRSLMADLLDRRTDLAVCEAVDDARLDPGTVSIAPPNRHLLVRAGGRVSLSDSELVHFLRPSADLLFESLAGSFRDRVIAVVLSGTGTDGAMGVRAVKQVGGTVIAQDPETAEFAGMPQAAVEAGSVDFVLPLDEIAPAILALLALAEGAP